MARYQQPDGKVIFVGCNAFLDDGQIYSLKDRRDEVAVYRVEETLGLFVVERDRKMLDVNVAFGRHFKPVKHPKRLREGETAPPPPPAPRVRRCLVDVKTGTLYEASTGECLSTSQLHIVNVRAGGRLAA